MAELSLAAHFVSFLLFALAVGRGAAVQPSGPGNPIVDESGNRRAGVALPRGRLLQFGRLLLIPGALSLIVLGVYRSIVIRFPALTGTYEGMMVIVVAIDLFLLIGHDRIFRGNPLVLAGGTFSAFLFLVILNSPLIGSELYPPIPVLRSYWLVIHVAFAFVGLALFTVGLVVAILAFWTRDPAPLDRTRDRAVALGFVFYATGGIVFGAIWAEAAWGRFWGWDPKETWALITTLFYAGYLHLRYVRRISQRTARILVIIAWILAGFTYWGVNALMTGLHSYG